MRSKSRHFRAPAMLSIAAALGFGLAACSSGNESQPSSQQEPTSKSSAPTPSPPDHHPSRLHSHTQGRATMSLNDLVQRKLETLPPQPGVYVFYGKQRVVLYVGKARSLRSRVRSYFQPGTSDARAFVARLDQELIDLETFVTGSEKEAALLENQLIKAHQPRYNVKLKDDKDFLSLRINPAAPWPRIDVNGSVASPVFQWLN